MRLPLIMIAVASIVCGAIDFGIYKSLVHFKCGNSTKRGYCVFSVIVWVIFLLAILVPKKDIGNDGLVVIMWMLFSVLSIYVAKLLFLLFSLICSIFVKSKNCLIAPCIIALSSLGLLLYSSAVTPYQINVSNIDIEFDNLPKAFDNYKIVQFSDLHLGSYISGSTFIDELVDSINAQNANITVFTGDIVNRQSNEMAVYTECLKKLCSPDGVFSVLGNHDYGDYMHWESEGMKKLDVESLVSMQQRMNWTILNNSHTIIRNGNDSIAVIGVENWGDPPFKMYADLSSSYPNLNDSTFKILLSHNPAHWDAEIIDKTNIALTLSGHTHAMQCAFNIFGKYISPAVFRYSRWSGLYTNQEKQYLYVNSGIGEVAIPARIGVKPEITVITIHCKE